MTMIIGNSSLDTKKLNTNNARKQEHQNDTNRSLNFGNVSMQLSFNDGNHEGYYKVRPKALKSSGHNPRPDWVIDDNWLVKHVCVDMEDIFESNLESTCLVKLNEEEIDGKFVERALYPEFENLINNPNIAQKKEYDFLVSLSKSMRETGQIQPIEIESDYQTNTLVVLEGHLRRLACILGRIPYIKAIRNEGLHQLSTRDKIGRQIVENSLRTNISAYGNYMLALDEIKENPKITVRDLRDRLKIKREFATVLLRIVLHPERFHPMVFETLKSGRLSGNNFIKVAAIQRLDSQELFIIKLLKKNKIEIEESKPISVPRGKEGRKKSVASMQIKSEDHCILAGNKLLTFIPQLKEYSKITEVSSVEDMSSLLKALEMFLLDKTNEEK